MSAVAAIVGALIGVYRREPSSYLLFAGILTLFDALLSMNVMYSHLRRTGDWSLFGFYEAAFPRGKWKEAISWDARVLSYLAYFCKSLVRPDSFALLTLILAILGFSDWIFWSAVVATHLTAFAVIYAQGKILVGGDVSQKNLERA